MGSDPIQRLRLLSVVEAVTFLMLLLVAVPLKYGADSPGAVQVLGPVHGVAFIGYVIQAFEVRAKLRWSGPITARVVLSAVLPLAPFFIERWLRTLDQTVSPAPGAQQTGSSLPR